MRKGTAGDLDIQPPVQIGFGPPRQPTPDGEAWGGGGGVVGFTPAKSTGPMIFDQDVMCLEGTRRHLQLCLRCLNGCSSSDLSNPLRTQEYLLQDSKPLVKLETKLLSRCCSCAGGLCPPGNHAKSALLLPLGWLVANGPSKAGKVSRQPKSLPSSCTLHLRLQLPCDKRRTASILNRNRGRDVGQSQLRLAKRRSAFRGRRGSFSSHVLCPQDGPRTRAIINELLMDNRLVSSLVRCLGA